MANGSTSKYSFPYPLSTDPVNVSGDIEKLAKVLDSNIQELIEDTSAEMWTGGTFSNGITSPTYNDVTGKMSMSLNQDISVSASPSFSGLYVSGNASFFSEVDFSAIPTSPTASPGTNSTQIATTEFVETALALGEGLPSQINNENKFLFTDGASASWQNPFPDQEGNAGKYLFTSGSALYWDVDDQFPNQEGNSGKFLKTNGNSVEWDNVPSPNNGILTMGVSGSGISGSAEFSADQFGNSEFTVNLNSSIAGDPNTIALRNSNGGLTVTSPTAAGSKGVREITMSTSNPSGGEDGDVWLQYE